MCSGPEDAQIAFDGVGLNEECISSSECIPCKQSVERTAFVRQDIVTNEHNPRKVLISCRSCDGTETRAEERDPVFEQEKIGTLSAEKASHAPPVEGVDRIDKSRSKVPMRPTAGFILRCSGEEDGRILALEGDRFD